MHTASEIRQAFLNYFAKHDHKIQASAPLVTNDPTLLFTNAGMVPFKGVFLGQEPAPAPKVTSAQRCLRAGGKHNDLDNVGRTARHHTLFEMLGNFSFGDYFKEQAIEYAWEFLVKDCGLDPNRLLVTYHHSDLETKNIWQKKYNLTAERLIACGDKDNFWSMGNTGPCGPCTEIFYDHGPAVAGGPPGSADEDGDRFVEIWNLVFMQYNQGQDGERSTLPKPCVDTGSGLERLAAVMQGVHDNYQTDQFLLLQNITKGLQTAQLSDLSLRVLSDHVRAIACMFEDGVRPSNEGQGYVMRRLLRRAACFMHRDGQKQPLLAKIMQEACQKPELSVMQQSNLPQAIAVIEAEEEQFNAVVAKGVHAISELVSAGAKEISGPEAFALYDTHGLPLDLTEDLAAAHKIQVDLAGFNACMQEQKQRSRQAAGFKLHDMSRKNVVGVTEFIGYDVAKSSAKVVSLYDQDWHAVTELGSGIGHIVLDQSVFYPEGGGQVADTGTLVSERAKFAVKNVQKQDQAIVLSGENVGKLAIGDEVVGAYDVALRADTARNHSATHLLHAALQKVLGSHVTQKGSLVAPDALRFDFSHSKPITFSQLQAIELLVLQKIRENLPVITKQTSFEEAKELGAMALFEGKYEDSVRLLSMGDFSLELCGGTHVQQLADIGNFAIINETAVAAGIRRIEAVTGLKADSFKQEKLLEVQQLAESLGSSVQQLPEKLSALKSKSVDLGQQLSNLARLYVGERVQHYQGRPEVIAIENTVDAGILSDLADGIMQSAEFVLVLSKYDSDKHLVIVASKSPSIHAGNFLKFLANKHSGKGGGKPEYARGQISKKLTNDDLMLALEEFKKT